MRAVLGLAVAGDVPLKLLSDIVMYIGEWVGLLKRLRSSTTVKKDSTQLLYYIVDIIKR